MNVLLQETFVQQWMSRAELIRLTTEGFYYIEPRTLKKAKQRRHIMNTRCEHVDIRATVLSKKSYIEYIYCKFEVQVVINGRN